MALRIVEFFGYTPLAPAAAPYISGKRCPFIEGDCIKPNHGACSVQQLSTPEPVICCPNRLYAENYKILKDIAESAFGTEISLIRPSEVAARIRAGSLTGSEVAVFGRYWGQELPLPRPRGAGSAETRKYYVDWMLARLDASGQLSEITAVEVQTIDTTGNYSEQAREFFAGRPFTDRQGREAGYSDAGMNWENVNKRILPQLIYKGHVLRRESKCTKGLFFVCPKQVYERIRDRLGGNLHTYQPHTGAITFRSYELGPETAADERRAIQYVGQFTTTVDQVALAFTAPMNLPDPNVYEAAIKAALGR